MRLLIILFLIFCCSSPKDKNDLGLVTVLPKGEYTIYNWGSRHMVKCVKPDGKYYLLNDHYFKVNGIKGYDAHQYSRPAKYIIK